MNRKMAAASAAVCRERDTIHLITEVDVTDARRRARESGVSLTALVVATLARALREHSHLNSLVSRGRLVTLDGLTIGVLVEREIGGELVPEPLAIEHADELAAAEIAERLRGAREAADERLGGLSGATWVRFVPSFLFRAMIRTASRRPRVAERYGVVSVTSVGMFSRGATWMVPLSASTVAVSVGGLVPRPVVRGNAIEQREHLCLTLSFDHDIVDGAPAARFATRFGELLESGEVLEV